MCAGGHRELARCAEDVFGGAVTAWFREGIVPPRIHALQVKYWSNFVVK